MSDDAEIWHTSTRQQASYSLQNSHSEKGVAAVPPLIAMKKIELPKSI